MGRSKRSMLVIVSIAGLIGLMLLLGRSGRPITMTLTMPSTDSASGASPSPRSTVPGPDESREFARAFLEGRVVELGDGSPIPGAVIVVNAEGQDGTPGGSTSVESDEDGGFRLAVDTEEPFQIDVRSPGEHARLILAFLRFPSGRLRIPLIRACGLVAQVVDEKTFEPIQDAEVELWRQDGGEVLSSLSGADGFTRAPIDLIHIALEEDDSPESVLRTVQATIRTRAPSYVEETLTVRLCDLHLGVPRQIALRRGAHLRGIVVGPTGKPVGGAWVSVVWRVQVDLWRSTNAVTALSDRDGGFVLEYPMDASECRLLGLKDEFGPGFLDLGPHDLASAEPVVLTLEARNDLRGTVTDAGGEAIPDVGVFLQPVGRPAGLRYTQWLKACYIKGFGEAPLQARTDADGAFLVARIPAGEYRVQLVHPAHIESGEGLPEVTIPFFGTWAGRMMRGGSICGMVIDREGNPLSGAMVEATKEGGGKPERYARTDAEGLFVVGGLAWQDYRLCASKRGFGPGCLDSVAAGSEDALLILEESSSEVRAKMELMLIYRGHPVDTMLPVAFYDDQGHIACLKASKSIAGLATLEGVPAGRFTLVLTPLRFAPVLLRGMEVGSEEGAPHIVELEKGQSSEVLLATPPDGETPKSVSIFDAKGRLLLYPPIPVAEDGRFTIREGREGDYVMRFQTKQEKYEDQHLSLRFPAPGVMEVLLRPKQGEAQDPSTP
ncbi:MAG: carboxypeptidase regulatory-like domain-containing protein [Planctomycetes bacterium]|nr:carboxypeptidase regulatory-like domain-containing protein [Planctomycetota bacterium]